jgi:hypothetical protein
MDTVKAEQKKENMKWREAHIQTTTVGLFRTWYPESILGCTAVSHDLVRVLEVADSNPGRSLPAASPAKY